MRSRGAGNATGPRGRPVPYTIGDEDPALSRLRMAFASRPDYAESDSFCTLIHWGDSLMRLGHRSLPLLLRASLAIWSPRLIAAATPGAALREVVENFTADHQDPMH